MEEIGKVEDIIFEDVQVKLEAPLEDFGRTDGKGFQEFEMKGRSKLPPVNPSGKCIFCLRKTSTSGVNVQWNENLEKVPTAPVHSSTASNLLGTFNQIWPYLLQHNFQGPENLIGFIEKYCGKTSKVIGLSQLPTMCQVCADSLKSVDSLLKSLTLQVKKLADAIQEARTFKVLRARDTQETPTTQGEATFAFQDQISYDLTSLPVSPSTGNIDVKPDPIFHTSNQSPVHPLPMSEEESDSGDTSGNEVENDSDPDYVESDEDDTGALDDRHSWKSVKIKTEPVTNTFTKTVNEETGKEIFACKVTGCGKKMSTKSNLQVHQQRKHGIGKHVPEKERNVICDICGKRLCQKRDLAKHKRLIHENLSLDLAKCDLCTELVQKEQLFEHVRAHVGGEYVIKCPNPHCKFAFSQPFSLNSHLIRAGNCRRFLAAGERPTKKTPICELCGFVSSSGMGFGIRDHLNQEHENATKNYSCPISGCSQSFTVKQSVVLHLPQHDFSSWLSFQRCPLCRERIKTDEMEEHLKDKHQVPVIIKCNQCSFLFSTREQLIEHLNDHRFGALMCDICDDGVKYSKHATLRDHYFKVHKIGVKYSCEQCKSEFWSKENLAAHVEQHKRKKSSEDLTRERPRPFVCEICGKTFLTGCHLQRHNLIHTRPPKELAKRKEFQCEMENCGKLFKNKWLLQRHHQVTHIGVKHVCELCGKSYADTKGLRSHRDIVHLGLRPYVCEECGESFGSSQVLKRHKLVHTGDRPFPCEICGQRFRHKEALKPHLASHQRKGTDFKPNGPMKQIRKRVERKRKQT